MRTSESDRVFDSGVAELYERLMVPLIFEPYASALAQRLAPIAPKRVLELAAGTGVATRAMSAGLPESTSIVATDLNQAMIDQAIAAGTSRPVEWKQADALDLPFVDEAFDAVVCQFGAMFFPDKVKAFAEVRRVLRPGGTFMFSVWDRIEDNEFADVVTTAVASMFPEDPPIFLRRTPHGYFDRETITRHLSHAGFKATCHVETVSERSRASSAAIAAVAYCQGTPLRNEIEARDASRLVEATDVATRAIADQFGEAEVDGKIQAHFLTVTK